MARQQSNSNRTKLEKAADWASIISAISILGVAASFWQISVSNSQFQQQFNYQRIQDSIRNIADSTKQVSENLKTKSDIQRLTDQFKIINQGYLVSELNCNLAIVNNVFARQMNEGDYSSSKVSGLNMGFQLNNIGNIPLKYVVSKADVYLNNVLVSKIHSKDYTFGILYPKQSVLFFLKTIEFPKNKYPLVLELKNYKALCVEQIRYYDIGSTHPKIINRKIEITFSGNVVSTTYKSIEDKI